MKHTNKAGKVKRHHGVFLGVRGVELGLRNAAWAADKWIALDLVVDAWKQGAGGEVDEGRRDR